MIKLLTTARLSHIAAVLAAGAALATTVPAQADESVGGQSNAQASSNTRANAQRNRERRICVDMDITGSRMARRVCRTEAEWRALEGELPN